jgi:hypothetical protein
MFSNLFLAMCKTMAGIAHSPPRRHLPCRNLCIPPLLVHLARLSTHLMGQRRWYHPLEEHFMLSNLTPSMCKTMAGLVYRELRCRCLLLSQRLQPDSLSRPVCCSMRYPPPPAKLLPLLLVLLARLSTHTVGKRRWNQPLEEHIVLSNLFLSMCKTMARIARSLFGACHSAAAGHTSQGLRFTQELTTFTNLYGKFYTPFTPFYASLRPFTNHFLQNNNTNQRLY